MTKATNTTCSNMELGGCGLKWRGSSVKGIVFCSLHKAAPELLDVLKNIAAGIRAGNNIPDWLRRELEHSIDPAISHAEAPGDE